MTEACKMPDVPTPRRQRVTWSAEERADWVRVFEASGKSVAEFCRENDLPEATLSLWRRQQRGPEPAVEPGALVQIPAAQLKSVVPRAAAPADRAALKVRLPGGIELDVTAGTDVEWIAGIVRALQVADA